jgi:hypothetical protein
MSDTTYPLATEGTDMHDLTITADQTVVHCPECGSEVKEVDSTYGTRERVTARPDGVGGVWMDPGKQVIMEHDGTSRHVLKPCGHEVGTVTVLR